VKKLLIAFAFLWLTTPLLFAQTTLYDDSRVSSIYLELPADSLAVIMTDVLSDHYFMALFMYRYLP